MRRVGRVAFFMLLVIVACRPAGAAAELGLDERVDARRAIEEVYWRHRIWPKDNPGPKPPLSAVLSDDEIREKVADSLRMTTALETFWRRPIASDQLQAELNRMAKATQDGETLREIHAALGNDPSRIVESLVRPILAEREMRALYAADARIHGDLKLRAERALSKAQSIAQLEHSGGSIAEATFRLRKDEPSGSAVELSDEEWRAQIQSIADRFQSAVEDIPIGTPCGLRDDETQLTAIAVRSRTADEITIVSVTWPKRSFESWWSEARNNIPLTMPKDSRSYSLLSPRNTACNGEGWQTTFGSPDGAAWHTAVWTGSEMIVWGGTSGVFLVNTGARYSPATDTWLQVSAGPNAPSPRMRHTAVWTGTEMIVWGGYGGPETNTGGRYDPLTDSWAPTSIAGAPQPRREHVAVWTGSQMIVWGGYVEQNDAIYFNSGGRYDPSTDTWLPTSRAGNVPTARSRTSAIWTGSRMIVWGGTDPSSSDGTNTGGRYNPSSDTWLPTSTGAGVPARRSGSTAVWTGSIMIVWGGGGGGYLGTGGRYDPVTDTWLPTSTGANAAVGRVEHTAVWTGSKMVVWGGYRGISPENTGGRYDPATDSWLPSSTGANTPIRRFAHTAIWTGTRMIVWGGGSVFSGFVFNSGGRYDPATDTWTATSNGPGTPAARRSPTVVWTGAEMIVWGGMAELALNTGGRYDPATDSWSATPVTADTPTARNSHSAVWTGSEMIVWGGAGANGGRYNPASNSWVRFTGGPSGSVSNHTSVWTGTLMVVWGGGGSGVNTGGRYNPLTGWTSTSIGANTPEPRYYHSAVWTGSEMIVWGGRYYASGMQYPTNGGRYDPSTDSWLPTSTGPGLPERRSLHTAVWTGSRMIVWGGYYTDANDAYFPIDGGVYDPAGDSWQQTDTGAYAPSPRTGHSAVWTGTEVIVWGGSSYTENGPTGGRYNPAGDSWLPTSSATAPVTRSWNVAVWTGTKMLVWGGEYAASSNVAAYCPGDCPTPTRSIRDLDGDGYGDSVHAGWTCDGTIPPGYMVGKADDCDDLDASKNPYAAEVCNTLDDDCDTAVDEGFESIAKPTLEAARAGNDAFLSWTPAAGATMYDVVRGSVPLLSSSGGSYASAVLGCVAADQPETTASDPALPGTGDAYWYLVRGQNCQGVGSFNGEALQQQGNRDSLGSAPAACP